MVYGPNEPKIGRYAAVTELLLKTQADLPLLIDGNATESGDFVHVDDICKANILAMNNTKLVNETINVGGDMKNIKGYIEKSLRYKRKIHTIGDSHAVGGFNTILNIHYHTLGPKTCYRFGRETIDIRQRFGINEGETVIFCLGEIDCRNHIKRHCTDTRDYKNVIDELIANYFESIRRSVGGFTNLKVSVYNVVPAVRTFDKHVFNIPDYIGSDEERKSYALYFNERIAKKCTEYNYIFFNVYNYFTDSDGFMDKKKSDVSVHIRDVDIIEEFIENNLRY
jgi:hypothetical protein